MPRTRQNLSGDDTSVWMTRSLKSIHGKAIKQIPFNTDNRHFWYKIAKEERKFYVCAVTFVSDEGNDVRFLFCKNDSKRFGKLVDPNFNITFHEYTELLL